MLFCSISVCLMKTTLLFSSAYASEPRASHYSDVRDREQEKIAALDAGPDDYITKPFGTGELLARVRVVLRRAQPASDTTIFCFGQLQIAFAARVVTGCCVCSRSTPEKSSPIGSS
jgi:hypothetical protein